MRYCAECVLPDSRPNLEIDKSGICSACNNFNSGIEDIDWAKQLSKFETLISSVKKLNKSGHLERTADGKRTIKGKVT